MGGIHIGRWLAGGVAAGLLIWVLEGLASVLYGADMEAVLQTHGLAMEVGAETVALSLVVSLIAGLVLVFFYAAARPRFGPGAKAAVVVGVAYWLGAYVLSLLGYGMLGLFPSGMLVLWGALGLVEILLAALLGGWIYREGPAAPAAPVREESAFGG